MIHERAAAHASLAVLAALVALTMLAASGCAVAPPRTGPAPGGAPAQAGYDQRVDDLKSVDVTALAHRRIVLDPGHGGFFRGALGVGGLTEAETNLGVALHLRGLLEAQGATVFMTRTDDSDFLAPADSSLRFDLAERTQLANTFGPDLFVSIHHNADAGGAHDVNEIQTYYKLGDEGPSLDAAQSVHRYLVRNLAIGRNRVVPGNYHVLRNSIAPALLTESSYITNPEVEKKLVLASKQRLEAEALFLGIAHYFARRGPAIEELSVFTPPGRGEAERSTAAGDSVFGETGEPRLRARISGAYDHLELTIDGVAQPLSPSGEALVATPAPLPPGRHVAVMNARLAGRGAARARAVRFEVRRPIDPGGTLSAAAWPEEWSEHDAAVAVRAELQDRAGFPVADSLLVRFRAPRARFAPEDTTAVARDGVAWAYFRPLGDGRARDPATVTVELPSVRAVPAARATLKRAAGGTRGRAVFLRAGASQGDSALVRAPGTVEPRPAGSWLNRDGFAVVPLDPAGRPSPTVLPGYRPWAGDGDEAIPVTWSAIANGALHDRRIVIDPDGGGENPAGVGPDGTRGANLNLEVARALEGFLTAAGAQVLLTRRGDFALSEVERVQMNEAFHADRFVRIGHPAAAPRLGYYFTSAAGKRWAEGTARELARFGLGSPAPAEDAQYPLQQTSCPALYVAAARVDVAASESRLLAAGTLRTEAYALFLALAREWAGDASWPLDSLAVMDDEGRPLQGASVVLGGALVLETDAQGRARFARTEPGPIGVEVRHPELSASRRLLESQRSVTMTGSRGP